MSSTVIKRISASPAFSKSWIVTGGVILILSLADPVLPHPVAAIRRALAPDPSLNDRPEVPAGVGVEPATLPELEADLPHFDVLGLEE